MLSSCNGCLRARVCGHAEIIIIIIISEHASRKREGSTIDRGGSQSDLSSFDSSQSVKTEHYDNILLTSGPLIRVWQMTR